MKQRQISSNAAWWSLLLKARIETHLGGHLGYYRMQSNHSITNGCLDEHLCWYVNSGRFSGRIQQQQVELEAGSMLWIMPKVPFRFEYRADAQVQLYRFRLRIELSGQMLRLNTPFVLVPRFPDCGHWCERIIHDIINPLPGLSGEGYRRGLILCLMGHLLNPELMHSAKHSGFDLKDQARIALWVNEHLALPVGPTKLAAALGYNRDYFSRQFKKTYGEAPRVWLVRKRMQYAAIQLLQSTNTVGVVAMQCGFDDLFHFSRQFKKFMGISPHAYRSGKKNRTHLTR